MVIVSLPSEIIQMVVNYNENINDDLVGLKKYTYKGGKVDGNK
jgi:hypothetical protein